jgi:hypothetical protein
MARISREAASQVESMDGFEGRYHELDGYTVGFERYSSDEDLATLFKGQPDDRCQCPHWGVVLKGTLVYRYANEEDVITAGQAYYARPGHTPRMLAGTEVIEFSPTGQLRETIDAVIRNWANAGCRAPAP